jgi:hypothetical protein
LIGCIGEKVVGSTVVVSKEEPGDDIMRGYVMTNFSAQRDSHPDSPLVCALQVGTHFKIKKGGIDIRVDDIQQIGGSDVPSEDIPLPFVEIS